MKNKRITISKEEREVLKETVEELSYLNRDMEIKGPGRRLIKTIKNLLERSRDGE